MFQVGVLGLPFSAAVQAVDAVRQVNEALPAAKVPADLDRLFVQGQALVQQRRLAEARALFEQIVVAHPTVAAAYNNLGTVYAGLGDLRAASTALEMAIRLDPGLALAQQNLGDLHVRLAGEAFERARQIDPADTLSAGRAAALRAVLVGAESRASTAGRPVQEAASSPDIAAPSPISPGAAVQQLLERWARAWSQRDLGSYFACYAVGFRGDAPSAAAWQAQRSARIQRRSQIHVQVTDLVVSVNQQQAEARFRQHYVSDGLKDVVAKHVQLQIDERGQWRIVSEQVLP